MSTPLAFLRRTIVIPELAAFVASPRRRQRPHGAYRRLRRIDPVHRTPFGIWVLSRHADVSAALRHPAMSSVEANADLGALESNWITRLLGRLAGASGESGGANRFYGVFSESMLFRDPPDHTRLRSLVSKAFTRRTVADAEPRIVEIVDELLEPAVRRGSMELMHELAYPLPARVICELLGVPPEDHDMIARLSPALATGLDPLRSTAVDRSADTAITALLDYLNDLITRRRTSPGTDLLSELIAAEEAGDRLTHDELLATVVLLLIAGHETTANLLGNGLVALLANPGALERLRADPSLDATAVEELLRYDGPIQLTQRITLDEVEVAGATFPKGRMLILMTAAANRDPAAFAQPEELDLARQPNPHLGFGGGSHFCLGAPLARLEARIALRALLDLLPGLRLAGRPSWRDSFTIRGLSKLPLTWDPA